MPYVEKVDDGGAADWFGIDLGVQSVGMLKHAGCYGAW